MRRPTARVDDEADEVELGLLSHEELTGLYEKHSDEDLDELERREAAGEKLNLHECQLLDRREYVLEQFTQAFQLAVRAERPFNEAREALERFQTEFCERLLSPKRGRPESGHAQEWKTMFEREQKRQAAYWQEANENGLPDPFPSRLDIAAAVAEQDCRQRPDRWQGYLRNGSLDPALEERAARRIWAAIRRLQNSARIP